MFPLPLSKWPLAIHHSDTWQKWRKMSLWRFNYCGVGERGVSLWRAQIEWAICRTNWCLKSLQDLIGLKEEPGNGWIAYHRSLGPSAAHRCRWDSAAQGSPLKPREKKWQNLYFNFTKNRIEIIKMGSLLVVTAGVSGITLLKRKFKKPYF